MSRRARKNYHHLKVLSVSKPNQVKAILKEADDSLIHTLCECVHNVLELTVPVTPKQKAKLYPYKTPLMKLVDREVPLQDKRKILVQKGGNFLSVLLPPALAILEQLL